MRIILATGDTDLRLAIQLMLSEEPGLNIIGSASDCDGLIALVDSTLPDLAVMDWELPGRDIGGVLREIKSLASDPEIYLIVLGVKRSIRETVLNVGADEYMFIGDPPEKLLEAIRQQKKS